MFPGCANAREFSSTILGAHSAGGRGQPALHARRTDGQLPGVPQADDAAAQGDRVAACPATHVRESLQDRQGR